MTDTVPKPDREPRYPGSGRAVAVLRAREGANVAPCFLFLACEDSSYMTGQVLHSNGGIIVGS